MKKDHNTLCLVAGRSGGHLVPALTLAADYKSNNPQSSVICITSTTALDKKITDTCITIDQTYTLTLDNIPGKRILRYPRFCLDFLMSIGKSFNILRKHKVTKIITTGGYIALPVCIAAYLLRIPIEVYELNALPGKAVTYLAPLATRIACCFQDAQKFFPADKVRYAPYPVRFRMSEEQRQTLPAGFSPTRKTLLILGGSQGSQFINTLMGRWLEKTDMKDRIQIIHQTGIDHLQKCTALYAQHTVPALVFDYNDSIDTYYRCADVVVCRSGAGSLFETLFFKKRCITIPLETATTDHQIHNAQALARQYPELVTVIMQKELEKDTARFDQAITRFIIEPTIHSDKDLCNLKTL